MLAVLHHPCKVTFMCKFEWHMGAQVATNGVGIVRMRAQNMGIADPCTRPKHDDVPDNIAVPLIQTLYMLYAAASWQPYPICVGAQYPTKEHGLVAPALPLPVPVRAKTCCLPQVGRNRPQGGLDIKPLGELVLPFWHAAFQ